MLLHATFRRACFFMRHTSNVTSCTQRWQAALVAWESRTQGTPRVRTTAKCAAHITFGEAATLRLPQSCPCSKIKARAAILWQPRCCCWRRQPPTPGPSEYCCVIMIQHFCDCIIDWFRGPWMFSANQSRVFLISCQSSLLHHPWLWSRSSVGGWRSSKQDV